MTLSAQGATALAVLIAASLPQTAFAHATLEVPEAAANSTYKATLRVPHGCDGEATHTLSVTIPEGFIAVKPMPKPGWTLTTEEGPYEKSYTLRGEEVASGVRTIVWSEGNLADAHYDEFVFRGRVTDFEAGEELAFEVVQTCANGTVEWVEVAAQGEDPHALKRPAPLLTIAGEPSAAAGAQTAPVRAGDLVIEGAWMRQPPPGARVGGGYMRITNTGEEPDTLLGGAAAFAGLVQIHEMALNDGMMLMREVDGGLQLAPGETVALEPGGYHVMFMELTEAPVEGETVEATLVFERAGEVTVSLPVAGIGARSHGHAGEH